LAIFLFLAKGSTEIVLIDRNMKQYAEQYKQPTSNLHVVNASYLEYKLKNWRSWIFEVGRQYEIEISAFTERNEPIYPSNDLVIQASFDLSLFEILYATKNGSYFHLLAKHRGSTVSNATLVGALNSKDLVYSANGRQEIELLDPIVVIPESLVFAYVDSTTVYEYQLNAFGGSGRYNWQSRNTSIFVVNSQTGFIRTQPRAGHAHVEVNDNKNIEIKSKTNVHILKPHTLDIVPCPIETMTGHALKLNLKMTALDTETGSLLTVSNCSKIQFKITIENEAIFKLIKIEPNSDISNSLDSCARVVLEALTEGLY
jgi:hypothetical protein